MESYGQHYMLAAKTSWMVLIRGFIHKQSKTRESCETGLTYISSKKHQTKVLLMSRHMVSSRLTLQAKRCTGSSRLLIATYQMRNCDPDSTFQSDQPMTSVLRLIQIIRGAVFVYAAKKFMSRNIGVRKFG